MKIIFTLSVSTLMGLLFKRIKVPGGIMVGALVGAALLSISADMAYMSPMARVAAQITAGAFIGSTISKEDLKHFKRLFKPFAVLLSSMLMVNIVMGFVIHGLSGEDYLTSFLCAVPGGMSDTPIIAADMGADAPAVALLQFFRMVAGVGVFPSIILAATKKERDSSNAVANSVVRSSASPVNVVLTMAVASLCGIVGRLTGVPVGTLLFSMLGVVILHLLTGRGAVPVWLKRVAQILSGAYIGSGLKPADVLHLRVMLLPALLLILVYMGNCFFVSHILHRRFGFSRREAMLVATPAGASDMALISGDIGVSNPDLNILQIARMFTVVCLFPQIINILAVHLP